MNTLANETHLCFIAVRIDSAVLVRKGPWITLQDILVMRHCIHLSSKVLPDALNWSEITEIPAFLMGLKVQSGLIVSIVYMAYWENITYH